MEDLEVPAQFLLIQPLLYLSSLYFHAVCRSTIRHCPRPLRAPCPGAKIRLPGAKLCEAPGPRLWKKCPAGIDDSKAYNQTTYIYIYTYVYIYIIACSVV